MPPYYTPLHPSQEGNRTYPLLLKILPNTCGDNTNKGGRIFKIFHSHKEEVLWKEEQSKKRKSIRSES
jgi:hypothetical protein